MPAICLALCFFFGSVIFCFLFIPTTKLGTLKHEVRGNVLWLTFDACKKKNKSNREDSHPRLLLLLLLSKHWAAKCILAQDGGWEGRAPRGSLEEAMSLVLCRSGNTGLLSTWPWAPGRNLKSLTPRGDGSFFSAPAYPEMLTSAHPFFLDAVWIQTRWLLE